MAMIDDLLARLAFGEQAEAKPAVPAGIPPMLARDPAPAQEVDVMKLLLPKMPAAKPEAPVQTKPAPKPIVKPVVKVPAQEAAPIPAPAPSLPSPVVEASKEKDSALAAVESARNSLNEAYPARLTKLDLERLQGSFDERVKSYKEQNKPDHLMEAIIALGPALFGILAGGPAGAQAAVKGSEAAGGAIAKMGEGRQKELENFIENERKKIEQQVNLERADIGAYTDLARIDAQRKQATLTQAASQLKDTGKVAADVAEELRKYGFDLEKLRIQQDFKGEQADKDRANKRAVKSMGPAGGAKTTEGERKAAGYLGMVRQANAELSRLGGDGGGKFPSLNDPLFDQKITAFSGTGIKDDVVKNMVKDPGIRSQITAELNWGTTVLRDESGAAISAGEFAKQAHQYFPRKGDSAQVIKQKASARLQKERALETMAGRAAVPGIVGATEAPKLTPEQREALKAKVRAKRGQK